MLLSTNTAVVMKFKVSILFLICALGLFAQDAPSFLAGFKYTIGTVNPLDGEPFDYFAVDESDFKEFSNSIRGRRKHKSFWLNKHFLCVTRCEVDGWVLMTFRGFDFGEISVFKEDYLLR